MVSHIILLKSDVQVADALGGGGGKTSYPNVKLFMRNLIAGGRVNHPCQKVLKPKYTWSSTIWPAILFHKIDKAITKFNQANTHQNFSIVS